MISLILHISGSHFRTLGSGRRRPSVVVGLFDAFAIPLIVGIVAYAVKLVLKAEVYGVAISVFSIFAALLLSVQMALFGIYQRSWDAKKDSNIERINLDEIELRRSLIRDVNTNVSYLSFVSCVSVTIMLSFIVFDFNAIAKSAIALAAYSHFFLTMILLIGRAYALFQREYEE